ncbi:hypothetical protein BaRGS_00000627 [Batillaria attramentaria]|uniref:Uncharacterized protein n=1 Tax=Batillaria attramentaria TaxID=370345 RepID=A0ABD0M971_9CAEN
MVRVLSLASRPVTHRVNLIITWRSKLFVDQCESPFVSFRWTDPEFQAIRSCGREDVASYWGRVRMMGVKGKEELGMGAEGLGEKGDWGWELRGQRLKGS